MLPMAIALAVILILALAVLFFGLQNHRLKTRLDSKVQEVQNLNLKRTDFVANVSHELKTPLTSIRGYTETLRDGALKDAQKADLFLQKIEENAERLDLLIHDILDLSKLEATNTHLDVSEFDPSELFRALKELFQLKLDKKQQTLVIDNSVKSIRADRQLLEQAFSNLVSNANRYCPEGAVIEIHGKRTNLNSKPAVQFDVLDNGPGILEKDLSRIFERFYRADKSRNRAFGGTGLGLAIVKHIILSHRGLVRAENVEKGGMKFSLILPVS